MFEPAVKWSGSKRSQAKEIVENLPKEINIYYEPFCGGCSVLRQLLNSDIKVNEYICSDINKDLINLWNKIKENPYELALNYENLWNKLNKDDDKERKKRFFEEVRARYNLSHNESDFLFIMRTTTKGMPRYNKKGEFNNSFHITRNGIKPNTLCKILQEWSSILQEKNVNFLHKDYLEITSKEDDVLYLDPPYFHTKGMYFGRIDYKEFFKWLKEQKGYYLLSFDGISGVEDNTYDLPKELYSEHKYLKSGNSSFKRIIGKSKNSMVYESLYLK